MKRKVEGPPNPFDQITLCGVGPEESWEIIRYTYNQPVNEVRGWKFERASRQRGSNERGKDSREIADRT